MTLMSDCRLARSRTVTIDQVVASLRRQLSEKYAIDAVYVSRHAVRGKTVLEFRATNKEDRPLHVIVDGSGPGQAAWVVGASSADQAVEASEWNASVRADAETDSPKPRALGEASPFLLLDSRDSRDHGLK